MKPFLRVLCRNEAAAMTNWSRYDDEMKPFVDAEKRSRGHDDLVHWFWRRTRAHWKEPKKQSQNAILWILYNRGWSDAQGYVAVVAWWRTHYRKITPGMLEELETIAEQVWNEVQEKKMKKKLEKQQNSLRNRIIAILQQHPATTSFLAEKLNATSKAVDSHLYRLRREGLVARLSWGLYALATVASQGAGPKHTATTAEVRPTRAVLSMQ
jgi:DNA-binding transcriptional ArsR family regulator